MIETKDEQNVQSSGEKTPETTTVTEEQEVKATTSETPIEKKENEKTEIDSKNQAKGTDTKIKAENSTEKTDRNNYKKEPVKMNKTLKKILLYFAILGAAIVTILWIGHIWWNIGIEVIWRTIATYIVLFISISLIPTVPNLYRQVKYYPELVSIGVWLLSITIAVICLVICVAIWKPHSDADVVWKTIATMLMINFGMIVAIFAMDKWWSRSPE